jgi:hypothetical protein
LRQKVSKHIILTCNQSDINVVLGAYASKN